MRLTARSLLALSLFLTACPPATTTETLEVTPSVLSLQTGETRTVTATVKSGSTSSAAAGAMWTSSDDTVVSVSSTGDGTAALQGLTAGTATVTAKLRDMSASVTVTVTARTITLAFIELTPASPSLAKGTTLQLTATGHFSDGSTAAVTDATWTSADQAVLTVDATGLVTGLTAGTSQVTATKGSISANITVTVTAATLVAIDVTPSLPSIAKGTTQQLTATGRFSDNTTQDLSSQVTWTSATTSIVSVDSSGLATGVDVGSSEVSAALNGKSGNTTVTVTAAVLTAIDVTPVNPSLPLGTDRQLTATGRFSDNTTQDLSGQATWTSATPAVATVSNAGLAHSLTLGSSVISAEFMGVTGTTTVTVSAAELVSLAVTPVAQSLAHGLTLQFTATGTFSDNSTQNLTTSVVWSSSAPTTANVSNAAGSKGLVTALAVGNATITATSGTISNGTSLTVTAATIMSLQVTPTTPSVPRGLTLPFTAMALLSDGTMQNVTTTAMWTSGTTATATISNAMGSEGVLTAVAQGTSTITATIGTVSDSTVVTVTTATLQRIDVTPVAPSIPLGRTQQFTATGVYSDGSTQPLTTQVTWVSTPGTVATISNVSGTQGLLSTALTGNATVTATLGSVTGSQPVTVTAAALVSIDVTPALPSVAKGRTQQFTAMGTYTNNTTQNLTTQVTWSTGTPATASISNVSGSEGLATTLATGNTTVVATLGSVTGQTTLTVTPAALVSIAISAAPATLPKGRTADLVATGTYSDNSTGVITTQVTWSSSPTTTATISNATGSNGRVTGVAVGTAIITATLGTVSNQVSIDITAAVLESLAISPPTLSIAKGRTQQYSVVGTFSDASTQTLTNSVTWGSSAPTVLSISNASGTNGLATALLVGSGNVTAQLSGVSASVPFTVTAAVLVSIAVTPTNPSIAKGRTQQFTATGTFSDNTTQLLTTSVVWSSNNGNATISNAPGSEGLATGALVGSATITATSGSVSGSTTLTIDPAVLVSIAVTPATPTLNVGAVQQFTATGTYSDNSTQVITTQVTWASSTASVSISNTPGSEGRATADAAGTSSVSATSGSVSGATLVTVNNAVLVSIAVTPANSSLAKGRTAQFTATGTYSDSSSGDITALVTWSTDAIVTASVSTSGLVTAVAEGTTNVNAALGTVTGSTSITITPHQLVSIAVTPAGSSLAKGRISQFTATGTYSDTLTADITGSVIWSTDAATIASITSGGLVTGVAQGTTNVNASLGSVSGSTSITITPPVLVSIDVTPAGVSVAKGRTQQYAALGTYSDSTTGDVSSTVTWSTDSAAIATISSTGLATAAGEGTTNVVATLGTVTGSTALTVTPAVLVSIIVSGAPASLPLGRTADLVATGVYSDSSTVPLTTAVNWTSVDPAIATVSNTSPNQGRVTAVALGSTNITATLGSVSGSATINTAPPVLVSIAVTPTNPSVATGATVQLTATGTYSDNSTQNLSTTATWASATGSIATVNTTGLVTALATGTSSVSATVGSVNGATTVTVTAPPPVVASTIPVSGSTGANTLGTISITFDRAMTVASLTTQTTPGACTGSIQVSRDNFATCISMSAAAPVMSGGNTAATITPSPALSFLTDYKIRVTTAATSSVGVALASTFTLATPFTTSGDTACATGIVISQIYGGGGNTSAPLRNDFIELHNPTPNPINVNGWAVQYTSSAGTTWTNITTLPNLTIAGGGYLLIQEASGGAIGSALPTADVTGTINLSASAGKVALTSNSTALVGGCPTGATIIDFVGFGGADCKEGTATTPAPSNTTAVMRRKFGSVDEQQNSTDFTVVTPVPHNSAVANNLVCSFSVNETNLPGEIDYCNLQFPPSITVAVGTPTEFIFGQIYEGGVTEAAGANALVRAEIGFGPVNANPQNQAGWVWTPAAYNVQSGNNDEYKLSIAPLVGSYRYTSRFSLDGLNWTYCDLNGAGSNAGLDFDLNQLGTLTVTP